MQFFISPMDTPSLLDKLAAHAPLNPFCSPCFFGAMRLLGCDPWIAGMKEGDQLLNGAGVFLRYGRINTTLEITSLPSSANTEEFWFGLLRFSAERRITQIEGNTYASPSCNPPTLPGQKRRLIRHEFVIDLTPDDIDRRMSKKHLQRVRKAIDSGLELRRSKDFGACRQHLSIVNSALDRRRKRGDQIGQFPKENGLFPFLESGVGEIFQAVLQGEPVASALVLRSQRGAYYQTSGARSAAMALGASDFLIHGIVHAIRSEGVDVLNLGGAELGSGLAQFKSRFGCTVISSTAVTLGVGPRWRQKLASLARLVGEKGDVLRALLPSRLSDLRPTVDEGS